MKWQKLEYYRLREYSLPDCELSFDISVSSGIIYTYQGDTVFSGV